MTPKPRRVLVRGAKLIGFAVVAFIVIGGAVLLYVDDQAARADLAPAPSTVTLPEDLPFTIEGVTFAGGDDLTLAGWFVPPQNGATIILLHGYGGNRTSMFGYAETLVDAGYGVLLYDERASGESEGQRRSYGWEDPADVGGALRYLSSRPEVDAQRIGIAGCSIGAQVALQAATRYPDLKAVWADGPSIVRPADLPASTNMATALAALSDTILDALYQARLPIAAPAPLIDRIDEIAPRPIMLVGGGKALSDFGSEAPRVAHYAQHAGPNAEVWVIPEAVHCDGPTQRPDEYAARLVQFFDAALGMR
jgi:dienelactone hydrolase